MIERLGYLISSHKGYEAPLARLLASLPETAEAIVVVGGYAERRALEVTDHTCYITTNHNSYDYTALIDFVDRPGAYPAWSHVFLLHDTMELGPQADAIIRSADPEKDATAPHGAECNLGLYRVDYVLERRHDLWALRNCTKLQAVEVEGFLWRSLPEHRRGSFEGDQQTGEPSAAYGGAPRQRVYYAGVDIVKWKANWGQTWPPNVVTP